MERENLRDTAEGGCVVMAPLWIFLHGLGECPWRRVLNIVRRRRRLWKRRSLRWVWTAANLCWICRSTTATRCIASTTATAIITATRGGHHRRQAGAREERGAGRERRGERGERQDRGAGGLSEPDRPRGVLTVFFPNGAVCLSARHVSVFAAHLSEKRSNEAKRLFSAFCNGLRDFTVFFATY